MDSEDGEHVAGWPHRSASPLRTPSWLPEPGCGRPTRVAPATLAAPDVDVRVRDSLVLRGPVRLAGPHGVGAIKKGLTAG